MNSHNRLTFFLSLIYLNDMNKILDFFFSLLLSLIDFIGLILVNVAL